jgi:hypothetical protein
VSVRATLRGFLRTGCIREGTSTGTTGGRAGSIRIDRSPGGNLKPKGYKIVDVSEEPYDGNPARSTDSLVRGILEPT